MATYDLGRYHDVLRILVGIVEAVQLPDPDLKRQLRVLGRYADEENLDAMEQVAGEIRDALFGEFAELGYVPTRGQEERLLRLVTTLLNAFKAEGRTGGDFLRTVGEIQGRLQIGVPAATLEAVRHEVEALIDGQTDYVQTLLVEKEELRGLVLVLMDRIERLARGNKGFAERLGGYREEVRRATSIDDLEVVKTRLIQATEAIQEAVTVEGRNLDVVRVDLGEAQSRIAKLERELEVRTREALTDRLTSVYNRRAFDEKLLESSRLYRRYRVPFSLVIFDIDRFKLFNDTYGHQAGDLALIKVTRKAQQVIRDLDYLARYGGEEFVIILPGTDLDGGAAAAEKVRRALAEREFTFRNEKVRITVSLGVAQYGAADSPKSVVARADKALYHAKAKGRNGVVSERELPQAEIDALFALHGDDARDLGEESRG